ncbi:MAG: efflux RND transporter periplasmic adaptor subunit [Desulfobacula sp.]|nr:efflux RND transporter periplasmic adaptor subunit [Desulfobacula sp.]
MKISRKANKMLKKSILFTIITASCLAAVMTLYSMEPEKEIVKKEQTPLKTVTVKRVEPGAYFSRIKTFGEVRPKWTTILRAQVNGEITYINKRLQPGDRLKTGEIILEVDKNTYQTAVAQAREALEDARVHFLKAERKADQARSDWNRSGFKGKPSSALVFHEPQLKAARARIVSSETALKKALQELDYTTVKSPYAGLVVERFANKGETFFSGDSILKMISADDVEIKVNLDAVQVKNIGKWQGANVAIMDSGTGRTWPGKIRRNSGMLDKKTRLQSFYIVPLEKKRQILPGMFVTVFIEGKKCENLMAIPESALTRDGLIWYADSQDMLRNIKTNVAFYEGGNVFIENSGNFDHMKVVITPVQKYIAGTKIHPVYEVEGV